MAFKFYIFTASLKTLTIMASVKVLFNAIFLIGDDFLPGFDL